MSGRFAQESRTETSLYECPSCHRVVRFDAGCESLGCLCDALPLGSDPNEHPTMGPRFGVGLIGPRRPYYHDREHSMREMPDDGREVEDDLRDGVWLA